ncbi:MAG: BatD family protein [Candidatus Dependentiae bacterium]
MKNILGNIYYLFLVLSITLSAQEISLDVATTDGDQLNQALVGQPFLAQVTIAPATSTHVQPELSGNEHMHIRPAGFQMQTINGASHITFNYRVYADAEGMFVLGPARLTTNNQSLVSNQVTVKVVADIDSGKKAKEAKAFMRLSCDKTEVVVGEKIRCTLRFYTSHKRIQLRHVGEPELNQCPFTVQKKQGPFSGVEDIDGTSYEYFEWSWELYPQSAGNCLIPAYYADYSMPSKKDDLFAMFTSVFATMNEQKRVYSNGVRLRVNELPQTQHHAQAVGTFQSFKASVESHAIKQGEGTVLTLELIGDSDFDRLDILPLQGMTPTLKWYESKKQVIQQDNNQQKKVFEYIIQATQAGDWEIPAQKFIYFDTQKRAYRTLTTSPLTIHVIAVNNQKNNQPIQENQLGPEELTEKKEDDSAIPALAEGPWNATTEKIIPWNFFIMLCILIAGASGGLIIFRMLQQGSLPFMSSHVFALKKVQKSISKAQKTMNYQLLYQEVRSFVIQKTAIDQEADFENQIASVFKYRAVPSQIQHQWEDFWKQLSEARFGLFKDKNQFADLFDRAHKWVVFWEELV